MSPNIMFEQSTIQLRAANEIFDINPDQLFKKTQIAMKTPALKNKT